LKREGFLVQAKYSRRLEKLSLKTVSAHAWAEASTKAGARGIKELRFSYGKGVVANDYQKGGVIDSNMGSFFGF